MGRCSSATDGTEGRAKEKPKSAVIARTLLKSQQMIPKMVRSQCLPGSSLSHKMSFNSALCSGVSFSRLQCAGAIHLC